VNFTEEATEMPSNPPIPIESSALLVVDAQDSFKALPRWERRNNPDFERNLERLVASYRDAGLPVVFVLHTDEDAGFSRTSPHFKVMDCVAPRDGEPVHVKTTRNAFTSTSLQRDLLLAGVRRIVVTGIQTEQCCETTARVGADLGFDVDFVTEATLTFPIANPETGRELAVDDVVERTEYALRGRFARIATVDAIVAEVGRAKAACARSSS
jgi:nicotinamidase-related amidase